MSLAARILAGDVKVIDAGNQAQALRQNLYLTDKGDVVIAPLQRPGWTRIAIKIKSPTEAELEALPCAA